jgi:glycosyltransferase involved in cell wall biosynthesis
VRVLFIHPNFPAQFRHMATALGADKNSTVVFATMNERPEWKIEGVAKAVFQVKEEPNPRTHFLARHFETAVRKGEGFYFVAKELRKKGFVPDVMVAHSGWGTSLFARDAFPEARLLCFFEWFYRARGADADFDPADPLSERSLVSIRAKNGPILIDLDACDFGYTPTRWQKAQFPAEFHHKIALRHDGIDVRYFSPDPGRKLVLPGLDLSLVDEVVTYATRGMEPYRGFPQFMEAVELLLKRRPRCHVVIAGDDRVSYGKPPAQDLTWKQVMLERLDLDMSRVHFTGSLPYGQYKTLLQASSAHVYLTRPFVLSWSMLEAMSCGCLLVASNTRPVQEVVEDRVNGLLVDFFSPQDIADRVEEALDNQRDLAHLREAARETIVERYALQDLLPHHLRMVADVAQGWLPSVEEPDIRKGPPFGG